MAIALGNNSLPNKTVILQDIITNGMIDPSPLYQLLNAYAVEGNGVAMVKVDTVPSPAFITDVDNIPSSGQTVTEEATLDTLAVSLPVSTVGLKAGSTSIETVERLLIESMIEAVCAAILNGDGTGVSPMGILNHSSVTSTVGGGSQKDVESAVARIRAAKIRGAITVVSDPNSMADMLGEEDTQQAYKNISPYLQAERVSFVSSALVPAGKTVVGVFNAIDFPHNEGLEVFAGEKYANGKLQRVLTATWLCKPYIVLPSAFQILTDS